MNSATTLALSQEVFTEMRDEIVRCPTNAFINVIESTEWVIGTGTLDAQTSQIAGLVLQEARLILETQKTLRELYDRGFALSHPGEKPGDWNTDRPRTGGGTSELADILEQLIRQHQAGGEGAVSFRIPSRPENKGADTSKGEETFSQEGEKGPQGKTRQIVIAHDYDTFKSYCRQQKVHPASMTYQEAGSHNVVKMRGFERGSEVVVVNYPEPVMEVLNIIVERGYSIKYARV